MMLSRQDAYRIFIQANLSATDEQICVAAILKHQFARQTWLAAHTDTHTMPVEHDFDLRQRTIALQTGCKQEQLAKQCDKAGGCGCVFISNVFKLIGTPDEPSEYPHECVSVDFMIARRKICDCVVIQSPFDIVSTTAEFSISDQKISLFL